MAYDYAKVVSHITAYLQKPELIMSDILKIIFFGKNDQLNLWIKKWNKIKFFLDEDADLDPSVTKYEYFLFCLNNFLDANSIYKYTIGSFHLPKNKTITVQLICSNNLKHKCIKFFMNEMIINKIVIENDSIYNFINLKKCIKFCDQLNLLNACKICKKL